MKSAKSLNIMALDCKLLRLFSPAGAVTSSSWHTATPRRLEPALSPGAWRMLSFANTMKIERRIYMQGRNKEVVSITDEGIVYIDYLVADYTILVNLIASDNCILVFDSEEAFNSLKKNLGQYIKNVCSIELAEHIMKFIAEEWLQQVSIIDYISHD